MYLTVNEQGKMRNSESGLEFRFKYHLNREREEGPRPLRGEEVIFREDEWALRQIGQFESF